MADALTSSPIVVVGHLMIRPGRRDEHLRTCTPVVAAARRTKGCLEFAVSADLLDADRVNVHELWTDRASLDSFRTDGPTDGPGDDQLAMIATMSVHEYQVHTS